MATPSGLVSIDDDTLAAVRRRWDSDRARLPALLDRPPGAGRLKSTRDQPLALPYARIACRAVRGERGTKGTLKDTRRVTIQVWGTKDQVVQVLEAAAALFHARMGAADLDYPSGAKFVGWKPTPENDRLEQDETVRQGIDVWVGTLEADVVSGRLEV